MTLEVYENNYHKRSSTKLNHQNHETHSTAIGCFNLIRDQSLMNISQLQSETFMTSPPPPTCKMSESEKITGESEVLLGFSMGGGLAMELALRLMVRLKGLGWSWRFIMIHISKNISI